MQLPKISSENQVAKHVSKFDPPNSYDTALKVCIIGDQSVGKTAIVNRYANQTFSASYKPTLGMDFCSKSMYLKSDFKVHVQLWDTAGQERFRSISHAYYKNAHAVVLVYDVSEPATLRNLAQWMLEIQKNAPADAFILVLGNKSDLRASLEEGILVKREEIAKLAKKYPTIMFHECSAKNGENVNESLDTLIAHCVQHKANPHLYKSEPINEVNKNGLVNVVSENEKKAQEKLKNDSSCTNVRSASNAEEFIEK